MRRIAAAVLAFVLLPTVGFAQELCRATCEPDPTSTGYSNTLQVETTAYNARGRSTPVSQLAANSGVAPAVSALAGSESYNVSAGHLGETKLITTLPRGRRIPIIQARPRLVLWGLYSLTPNNS